MYITVPISFMGFFLGYVLDKRIRPLSYWEIFSWITVVFLGIGSITVFLLFIKDIRHILKKFKREQE